MLLSQDWLFQIKFRFHLQRPLDDFKNNSSIPYTKTPDTSIVIRIYVVRHKLKHKTISRAVSDGIGSFSRIFFFFFFFQKNVLVFFLIHYKRPCLINCETKSLWFCIDPFCWSLVPKNLKLSLLKDFNPFWIKFFGDAWRMMMRAGGQIVPQPLTSVKNPLLFAQFLWNFASRCTITLFLTL